jgi:hypothetical protein
MLPALEFDDETVEYVSGIVETRRCPPFSTFGADEEDEDNEMTMIDVDVVTEGEAACPDPAELSAHIQSMLKAMPTLSVPASKRTTVPRFAPQTPRAGHASMRTTKRESWKFLMSWFAMGISIGLFVTALVALVIKF